jgi:mannose-6-phosphate isomerase-like protein (cupin superfamily)
MKKLLTPASILLALSLCSAASAFAQNAAPATVITAADMKAFLGAMPRDTNTDRALRVVDVGGYRVGIFGVHRGKNAKVDPVYHATKVTEVYYILNGSGTFVTGGSIPDAKRQDSSIGVPNMRGTKLEGGTSRHVAKGDIVIIPGGTPHWFSQLDSDIEYMIVRPDPQNEIPLK